MSNQAVEKSVSFPGKKPLKDPRREAFCREYTRHGDKQRAVVAAGFNCKTWEEGSNSASAMGCQLTRDVQVLERIQYLQEMRLRQADLAEISVLKELKRIAFFDIGALYYPNGALKPVHEWPQDVRHVVSAVDVEKMFSDGVQIGTTVKIKTNDKVKALEKLMQYFQMIEPPSKGVTVNAENAQVNFYLPENSRHAKTIEAQPVTPEAAPAQPSHGHGVALPSKTNGSH